MPLMNKILLSLYNSIHGIDALLYIYIYMKNVSLGCLLQYHTIENNHHLHRPALAPFVWKTIGYAGPAQGPTQKNKFPGKKVPLLMVKDPNFYEVIYIY